MTEILKKSLIKSFSGYSIGVFVSRISGMGRDMALAFFFGTAPEMAMFMVAYRFANLMRRMLAESPLSSSFIPVFESIRSHDPQEAGKFFRDLFFSLASIVLGIVIFAICGVQGVQHLVVSADMHKILDLTTLMLPSLLFICFYGLCSAFLQCEKKFFLPAVAPVAFNLVWVIGAWVGHHTLEPMTLLAYGVVIAFFAQWCALLPKVFTLLKSRLTFKELFTPRLFHPSLRAMVKPFLLGTLGIGATQINIALDSVFARYAHPEGPAFLWYAVRIQQVPMALFGVGIAAALLPLLTRSIKAQEISAAKVLLEQGFRQTFSLMAFSTGGLLALGSLVISVLFGRGEFHLASVLATTQCLYGYALGLIPHGWTLLLAASYYAYADFKTPTRGAIFSVLLNILLNALMVFILKWGPASIALGTSLTSLFNALYLHSRFKTHMQDAVVKRSFYLKTILCGLVATLLIKAGADQLAGSILSASTLMRCLELGGLSILYLGLYCILEKLLGCQVIGSLIKTQLSK